jgi:alpha-1,2-glucosyltransferase
VVALLIVMAYACDTRTLITRIWTRNRADPLTYMSRAFWMLEVWPTGRAPISFETLHTAFNIALFPPLFFFSGLFYTDVLSTCLVLRAYRLFLERKGAYRNRSLADLAPLYFTGMTALSMRQTNIFWVAVFLGALELVRNIQPDVVTGANERLVWKSDILGRLKQYAGGHIHDVPLKDAGILGIFHSIRCRDFELMNQRFCTLPHQYCGCCHLPSFTYNSAMAIHCSSCLFRRIRNLEWWSRSRYALCIPFKPAC